MKKKLAMIHTVSWYDKSVIEPLPRVRPSEPGRRDGQHHGRFAAAEVARPRRPNAAVIRRIAAVRHGGRGGRGRRDHVLLHHHGRGHALARRFLSRAHLQHRRAHGPRGGRRRRPPRHSGHRSHQRPGHARAARMRRPAAHRQSRSRSKRSINSAPSATCWTGETWPATTRSCARKSTASPRAWTPSRSARSASRKSATGPAYRSSRWAAAASPRPAACYRCARRSVINRDHLLRLPLRAARRGARPALAATLARRRARTASPCSRSAKTRGRIDARRAQWDALVRPAKNCGSKSSSALKRSTPPPSRAHIWRDRAHALRMLRMVLERGRRPPPRADAARLPARGRCPACAASGVRLAIENHFDIPSSRLAEAVRPYPPRGSASASTPRTRCATSNRPKQSWICSARAPTAITSRTSPCTATCSVSRSPARRWAGRLDLDGILRRIFAATPNRASSSKTGRRPPATGNPTSRKTTAGSPRARTNCAAPARQGRAHGRRHGARAPRRGAALRWSPGSCTSTARPSPRPKT